MAVPDLSKLQELLANAEQNEQQLNAIKKAYSKVQTALDDFATLLSDEYQPAKKERKPQAERPEGAKRPGRPKKNQAAE
jgi:hypothetical protein